MLPRQISAGASGSVPQFFPEGEAVDAEDARGFGLIFLRVGQDIFEQGFIHFAVDPLKDVPLLSCYRFPHERDDRRSDALG